ncbi:MAG TPA: hydroxysqualene dehydroxylase HpnE [Streptosporangiaceae bacterium]|nr:hydroxysqualene dehydroxylase HpnE [Streptosporangiaceae bacterium]
MTAQAAAPHVAVIGGGLAGITAAIALAETGTRVTLLESRPRLGGATSSFSRGGLTVDNGQHVFLRCCTAYRGLLARLGMTGSVTLQDRFEVTVLRPGGRARLRRTALPGPLHMGQALAGYRHLSYAERLAVVPAALAMTRLDPASPGLDGQRLGDWLAAHGQGEHARRVLWDLFTVSSLNVSGDDANLALAATVVKTALLSARDAADIGIPAVPLGDLHGQAAASLLGRLRARVRLGAKAAAVAALPSGGFLVRLASRGTAEPNGGEVIRADGVVLAVPPEIAACLLPAGAGPAGLTEPGPGQWLQIATSPIVNVHVVYDRRVTRLPFAAAVDSPVQWVFDRTGPSGLREGQYLAISLSAADAYADVPAARLREQFLPALAELFPAAAAARVVDCFITRERRATMRQVPGLARLRPGAATGPPGLVLAGAWTDTGWPDTMEGAVRSGLNAVRELRRNLGSAAVRWAPGRTAGPVSTGLTGAQT